MLGPLNISGCKLDVVDLVVISCIAHGFSPSSSDANGVEEKAARLSNREREAQAHLSQGYLVRHASEVRPHPHSLRSRGVQVEPAHFRSSARTREVRNESSRSFRSVQRQMQKSLFIERGIAKSKDTRLLFGHHSNRAILCH
jgi:hypothetical protein